MTHHHIALPRDSRYWTLRALAVARCCYSVDCHPKRQKVALQLMVIPHTVTHVVPFTDSSDNNCLFVLSWPWACGKRVEWRWASFNPAEQQHWRSCKDRADFVVGAAGWSTKLFVFAHAKHFGFKRISLTQIYLFFTFLCYLANVI